MKNSTSTGKTLAPVLGKEHQNKWVALSKDRKKVMGYSENLSTLTGKIGTKDVVYMKVMPGGTKFAF